MMAEDWTPSTPPRPTQNLAEALENIADVLKTDHGVEEYELRFYFGKEFCRIKATWHPNTPNGATPSISRSIAKMYSRKSADTSNVDEAMALLDAITDDLCIPL